MACGLNFQRKVAKVVKRTQWLKDTKYVAFGRLNSLNLCGLV